MSKQALRWEDSGGGTVVSAEDYDALLAENQRLRDALHRIKDETETVCPGPNHDYEAVPTRAARIARIALGATAIQYDPGKSALDALREAAEEEGL